MTCEEVCHVLGAQADEVDDTDARENALCGPPVDGRVADAEQLRDLADGEELFDRR